MAAPYRTDQLKTWADYWSAAFGGRMPYRPWSNGPDGEWAFIGPDSQWCVWREVT